jgi:hypothetical protein
MAANERTLLIALVTLGGYIGHEHHRSDAMLLKLRTGMSAAEYPDDPSAEIGSSCMASAIDREEPLHPPCQIARESQRGASNWMVHAEQAPLVLHPRH